MLPEATVWWLWTAYDPVEVHTFEVAPDCDDVAWLGEGAWTYRHDNMGIGLLSGA